MISMYTKQEIIIKSYREGKSQRAISRELKINRKTVRKYIEEYEGNVKGSLSDQERQSITAEYFSEAPVYRVGIRPKYKLTEEIKGQINDLLEHNEQNRSHGMRKQILKKKDIHQILVSKGYDIGYTTVSVYIRNHLSEVGRPREAFIRQEYRPGQSCEFDWGLVKLEIGGQMEDLQMAVFTSSYSNYRYATLFRRQDSPAFQEAHVSFIEHAGVVHEQMLYDNMRVAVAKFVGEHEKEPTQALLQLRGHYGFTHRFCNLYSGNEKGHVERSVEYVRRRAFGLHTGFAGLKEAEAWLHDVLDKLNGSVQQLTGKTALELFEEEKKVLAVAPVKMLCAEVLPLKVDKYSTVSYKTNRYSVPDHLVGRYVDARISSHHLQIYEGKDLIATHPRTYGARQWNISIEHYLTTFRRKPGALAHSVALAGRSRLKELYGNYFTEDARGFIDLLIYCRDHRVGDERLEEAVDRLKQTGVTQITSERLIALLGNQTEGQTEIPQSGITQLARLQLQNQASLLDHSLN